MPEESLYKPHLPSDKAYLGNVAKTIQAREPEDIRFEYLTELIESLGFEDPYALVSLDNLNTPMLQDVIAQAFTKLNSTPVAPEIETKLLQLFDYLAESDPLEESDLIFVFGGPQPGRAYEAIRLYKEKYAPKIMFSGQKSSFMKDVDQTEADYYASLARNEGVPEESLLLERESRNTPENAVKSITILKERNSLPHKIILVTRDYHMRRSYLTFKAAMDWSATLIRHSVPSEKYSRDQYWKDEEGWSYVVFEYIKMYGARLMKHF